MISRIHATTIVVADQDRALDFYVDTLGWQKSLDVNVDESMRFLTVKPPDGEAELALGLSSWFGEHQPPRATGISMAAEDIDAAYATLVERGVRFRCPVETMPWGGRATWFYDLDDNEFFLVGE